MSMEGLCVYIIPQMHCMLEISEIGFNLSSRFRADVSKKSFIFGDEDSMTVFG